MSPERANDIVKNANSLRVGNPTLRMGQAIIHELDPGEYNHPWSEMFHTECYRTAVDLLFSKVNYV